MDEIDWGVLEHAYGPAKDVPESIRALASPDADEREKARHTLYGNIFHQGTRYQATAYAVPFLLELLAEPATPDRAELAHLLTMLAVGYDEQWLPDTFPVERCRADAVGGQELLRAAPPVVDEWAEDDGEDEDDEDEEDRYSYYESLSDEDASALYSYVVLAAYDAVRAGVPLFRSLVADDDPALRTAAAYALAWFPEDAAGNRAGTRHRARWRRPRVAARGRLRARGAGSAGPRWWHRGCGRSGDGGAGRRPRPRALGCRRRTGGPARSGRGPRGGRRVADLGGRSGRRA
jgi:hypothetical protein